MKQNMCRPHFTYTFVFVCLFSVSLFAQTEAPPPPQFSLRDVSTQQASSAAASFDQVIDRAVEREHFFIAQMKTLHPLVETYLQNLRDDKDLKTTVPESDLYFLGRLDMSNGTDDRTFNSPTTGNLGKRMLSKLSSV